VTLSEPRSKHRLNTSECRSGVVVIPLREYPTGSTAMSLYLGKKKAEDISQIFNKGLGEPLRLGKVFPTRVITLSSY
jgi:hypothetical protein